MENIVRLANLYQLHHHTKEPTENNKQEIIHFFENIDVNVFIREMQELKNTNEIKLNNIISNLFLMKYENIFAVVFNKFKNHLDIIFDDLVYIAYWEKEEFDFFINKIPDFFERKLKNCLGKENRDVFESLVDMNIRYNPELLLYLNKKYAELFSEKQKDYLENVLSANLKTLNDKGKLYLLVDHPKWELFKYEKKNILQLYLEKYRKPEYLHLLLDKIAENKERVYASSQETTLFNDMTDVTLDIDILNKAFVLSDKNKIKSLISKPDMIQDILFEGKNKYLSGSLNEIIKEIAQKFGDDVILGKSSEEQELFANLLKEKEPSRLLRVFINSLTQEYFKKSHFLLSENLKVNLYLSLLVYENVFITSEKMQQFIETHNLDNFKDSHYFKNMSNSLMGDKFIIEWEKYTLQKNISNSVYHCKSVNRI